MALRILQRGEIWLDRTYWLVAIAALGGFGGALMLAGTIHRPFLLRRGKFTGAALAAFIFACAFMSVMMLGYAGEYLLFSGQFEPNPERPVRGAIFGFVQTCILFLISAPTYLLPWPLPVLSALAALLFARRTS